MFCAGCLSLTHPTHTRLQFVGGYELYASLVAGMGQTALASVSVLNATTAIWYMLPWAITTAAATLVGNALGAGKTRDAQSAALMSLMMVLTYGTLNGGLVSAVSEKENKNIFVWHK